jgi:DNA-binding IclR family transcriptional regulator
MCLAKGPKMRRTDSYLKTVDRVLHLLLQFSNEYPEWSTGELAKVLGLHRSIVYRMLTTLERRGFITQTDHRGRFRLGLKLIELGNVVLASMDLRQIAYPMMARLARETGESAFLTVISNDHALCIEKIDGHQRVRAMISIGDRYPLHAGASSKVLLAYLPSDTIDELIARGLVPITPNTITEPERLKEDLIMIRKQGWAYSIGELTPGAACVAAPLRNSNGAVVAALSLAGLISRFGKDRLPMLINMTRQVTEEISSHLLVWHSTSATVKL